MELFNVGFLAEMDVYLDTEFKSVENFYDNSKITVRIVEEQSSKPFITEHSSRLETIQLFHRW